MQLYIGNKNYSSWSMRAWLILTHFGIETTPLESVAPRYLGHVFGEARLEAWRARARRG